jgi:hypothetical protein
MLTVLLSPLMVEVLLVPSCSGLDMTGTSVMFRYWPLMYQSHVSSSALGIKSSIRFSKNILLLTWNHLS